jgi:catechol 2,3-dioxygenase-like lactoylglutathione lyase family enzyme
MIDVTGTTVTLMVEDLDRSQDFYTAVLGFELEYRAGPHFAMLKRAGLRIGLHPKGGDAGAGACAGIAIGFEVPDIHVAVRALEGAATLVDGIVEDGPILRADFRDPDGTALYLIQGT